MYDEDYVYIAGQDPMGEPCRDVLTVCWDNSGLPAPLPHCQQKTWPHELMCDFRDISLNSWAISVTNTLESVSALIHTSRFH